MWQCIDEINRLEAEAKHDMERNQNQETRSAMNLGSELSTVSKRMTRKVKTKGSRLGGAGRGKLFTAGRFQVT